MITTESISEKLDMRCGCIDKGCWATSQMYQGRTYSYEAVMVPKSIQKKKKKKKKKYKKSTQEQQKDYRSLSRLSSSHLSSPVKQY
jgi:hypothetical protein